MDLRKLSNRYILSLLFLRLFAFFRKFFLLHFHIYIGIIYSLRHILVLHLSFELRKLNPVEGAITDLRLAFLDFLLLGLSFNFGVGFLKFSGLGNAPKLVESF